MVNHKLIKCFICLLLFLVVLLCGSEVYKYPQVRSSEVYRYPQVVLQSDSERRPTVAVVHSSRETLMTDHVSSKQIAKTPGNGTIHDTPSDSAHNRTQAEVCKLFKEEIKLVHRVETHILGYRDSSDDVVCLVTQTAYSRMDRLQAMVEHWKGPVSAAVFVEEELLDQANQTLTEWFGQMDRNNIAIHLVVKRGIFFPINLLRNVAWNNTLAKYVFVIDIDFLPNVNLYNSILDVVKNGFFNKDKKALVVPSFEIFDNKTAFPATKSDVVQLFKKDLLTAFHFRTFRSGHGPTNSKKWLKSDKIYRVYYQLFYEPIMVVPRMGSPLYDIRFLHRYFNKIAYTYDLNYKGWTFDVLPDGYLVHMPHPKVSSTLFMQKCADQAWASFQQQYKKGKKS